MNELSWMIYLADVAHDLKMLCLIFGLAVVPIGGIFWAAHVDGEPSPKIIKRIMFLACALTAFAIFAPSRTAIYAIAASEIGEDALRSETGGKAMRALNAWLDRQIEGSEEAGNDE